MRLEKLTLKGWIPFVDEVSLDLTSLGDAKLVAFTGTIGSGKSTLIELAMLGAPYRQLLTRGKLSELAVTRDAFVESTIVNGSRYTFRQTCDAVSGSGECLIKGADGEPLPGSDTKSSWGKQWAADHLPDFDVLTAGLFSAQGSEGLIGAGTTERKRLILRAAGVERFERMAERARKRASSEKAKVDTLLARIADEKGRGGDIAALEAGLLKARQSAAQAAAGAKAAQDALDAGLQLAAECEHAAKSYRATTERQAKLKADIEQTEQQLADLGRRTANNQAVLAEGDAIRAAASELESRQRQLAQARLDAGRARAEMEGLQAQLAELDRQLASTRGRQARAAEWLSEGATIFAAVAQLPELEAKVSSAETNLHVAREKLDELQGQQLAGADERIVVLRGGLRDIEMSTVPACQFQEVAKATLAADNDLVEQSRVFPERLAAAKAEVQRLATEHAQALATQQATQCIAANAEALERAQADRDAALAELDTLTLEINRTRDAYEEARRTEETGRANVSNIEGAIEALSPAAAKLSPLQNAEARLAELYPQRDELTARLATLTKELSDTPEPSPPSPAPDVSGLRHAENVAALAAKEAQREVILAEQALENAKASAERIATLQDELDRANAELADWTRLAADLGKDGLQAAETDAIGPELTELTNDLLHNCFSTRWTVRVETQRASSDGKKAIEGCEIRVLDTETGQDCDAKRYSGGQRAIIGEAVSLALAMIACNRAGVTAPTLIRDESDAALNDENAEAYAKMLRRAAAHVGADRVLVISHKAALVGLCDAVIEVGNGTVKVA